MVFVAAFSDCCTLFCVLIVAHSSVSCFSLCSEVGAGLWAINYMASALGQDVRGSLLELICTVDSCRAVDGDRSGLSSLKWRGSRLPPEMLYVAHLASLSSVAKADSASEVCPLYCLH